MATHNFHNRKSGEIKVFYAVILGVGYFIPETGKIKNGECNASNLSKFKRIIRLNLHKMQMKFGDVQ